jgi:hypothetical protein
MRRSALASLCCLWSVACTQPPAIITDARKAELVRVLQLQVARSVQNEKSATLAISDADSERFAAASRAASAEVERARLELRPLVSSAERPVLDAFDAAWAEVVAVDARLLPLAVANSNLKAARLSVGPAAASLDVVLAALDAAAAKSPARQRQLLQAAVAASRIQALHAQHIASPDDAEMTALEARIAALQATVDAAVATLPEGEAPQAWAKYKGLMGQILELSRANTNVRSFSISIYEKAEATQKCEAALLQLVEKLHEAPRATR